MCLCACVLAINMFHLIWNGVGGTGCVGVWVVGAFGSVFSVLCSGSPCVHVSERVRESVCFT